MGFHSTQQLIVFRVFLVQSGFVLSVGFLPFSWSYVSGLSRGKLVLSPHPLPKLASINR